MAIKKSVDTVHGYLVNDAYHRVENVRLVNKKFMSFSLKSYVSEQYPNFNETMIHCDYDIAGKNPIAQAYEHLKTLPEFAGATDC